MKFDICSYILNESLASSVVREIINEPSGFFKYTMSADDINSIRGQRNNTRSVLIDVKTLEQKILTFVKNNLCYTLKNAVKSQQLSKYGAWNSEPVLLSEKDKLAQLSDEEIIKINKRYNDAVEACMHKCKNIGQRPKATLLTQILSMVRANETTKVVDMSTLTNSYFKKYNVSELKQWCGGNGKLKEFYVYLYFNENGEFLCASNSDKILCTNLFANVTFPKAGAKSRSMGKSHKEMALNAVERLHNPEQLFNKNLITYTSDNKTKLTWPITVDMFSWSDNDAKYGPAVLGAGYTNMSNDDAFISSWGTNTYKPGQPWKSTSNIAAICGWYKNPNNYCWVFNYKKYAMVMQKIPTNLRDTEDVQSLRLLSTHSQIELRHNTRGSRFEYSATWGMEQVRKVMIDPMFRVIPPRYIAGYYYGKLRNYIKGMDPGTTSLMAVVNGTDENGKPKFETKVIKITSSNMDYERTVDAHGYKLMYITYPDAYTQHLRYMWASRLETLRTLKRANAQAETAVEKQREYELRLIKFQKTRDGLFEKARKIVTDRSIPVATRQQVTQSIFGDPNARTSGTLANLENSLASNITRGALGVDLLMATIKLQATGEVRAKIIDDLKQAYSNLAEICKDLDGTFEEADMLVAKIQTLLDSNLIQ